MTENEIIENLDDIWAFGHEPADEERLAANKAIDLIQELQQYRATGTVEEIKEILQIISEGQDDVDESGISTGLLHTLLEYAEYKKIGTVEECQEARERQRAKKPVYPYLKSFPTCPNCGEVNLQQENEYGNVVANYDFCPDCGQAILWESDTP